MRVRARAGEDGRIHGGEHAALDGGLGAHGPVPVVVVNTGAVPGGPQEAVREAGMRTGALLRARCCG